jgi:hypothetical protein
MNTVTAAKRAWQSSADKYASDPDVVAARKAYDDAVKAAKEKYKAEEDAAYQAYQTAKRDFKPKARWPENTPDHIKQFCAEYWGRTSERLTYRIHAWNDDVVVTSYPAGTWSDNGGVHRGQAAYHAVSLKEKQYGTPKVLSANLGRTSPAKIQEMLKGA